MSAFDRYLRFHFRFSNNCRLLPTMCHNTKIIHRCRRHATRDISYSRIALNIVRRVACADQAEPPCLAQAVACYAFCSGHLKSVRQLCIRFWCSGLEAPAGLPADQVTLGAYTRLTRLRQSLSQGHTAMSQNCAVPPGTNISAMLAGQMNVLQPRIRRACLRPFDCPTVIHRVA